MKLRKLNNWECAEITGFFAILGSLSLMSWLSGSTDSGAGDIVEFGERFGLLFLGLAIIKFTIAIVFLIILITRIIRPSGSI